LDSAKLNESACRGEAGWWALLAPLLTHRSAAFLSIPPSW